jgi:hypothetical protein
MLRGGFQEQWQEYIERAETHSQLVQRLAIRLFEMSDRAKRHFARKKSSGICEHCRERADSSRTRRVARSRGELLERAQVSIDLGVDPALEPFPERCAGRC